MPCPSSIHRSQIAGYDDDSKPSTSQRLSLALANSSRLSDPSMDKSLNLCHKGMAALPDSIRESVSRCEPNGVLGFTLVWETEINPWGDWKFTIGVKLAFNACASKPNLSISLTLDGDGKIEFG